jgi:hypothetical protein
MPCLSAVPLMPTVITCAWQHCRQAPCMHVLLAVLRLAPHTAYPAVAAQQRAAGCARAPSMSMADQLLVGEVHGSLPAPPNY